MTTLIIFLAKYLVAVPVLLVLYVWYRTPDRRAFVYTAIIVGALSFVLSLVAAALYDNPRPFMLTGVPPLVAHAPGNGFPSDHALLTGTLAAIVTISSPYYGVIMWLLAVLVGAGRVLAHVHHTIDVIAAFGIAIISAVLVYYTKPGK